MGVSGSGHDRSASEPHLKRNTGRYLLRHIQHTIYEGTFDGQTPDRNGQSRPCQSASQPRFSGAIPGFLPKWRSVDGCPGSGFLSGVHHESVRAVRSADRRRLLFPYLRHSPCHLRSHCIFLCCTGKKERKKRNLRPLSVPAGSFYDFYDAELLPRLEDDGHSASGYFIQ